MVDTQQALEDLRKVRKYLEVLDAAESVLRATAGAEEKAKAAMEAISHAAARQAESERQVAQNRALMKQEWNDHIDSVKRDRDALAAEAAAHSLSLANAQASHAEKLAQAQSNAEEKLAGLTSQTVALASKKEALSKQVNETQTKLDSLKGELATIMGKYHIETSD